jgi:DNA-binding MarR family transcriptional regulator
MALPLDCYCASLRQATRRITQLYDQALRPAGLTTTQFTILRLLSQVGGARVGDLAEALAMEQSGTTRTLALMHAADLLEKDPHASARETRYVLTPEGAARLAQATPLWTRAQKRVATLFGKEQAEQLREMASALAGALES